MLMTRAVTARAIRPEEERLRRVIELANLPQATDDRTETLRMFLFVDGDLDLDVH